MVGISSLLALSLGMMVPAIVLKDSVFKKQPWLLVLMSGVMAFGIEVSVHLTVVCVRESTKPILCGK